MGLPAAAGIRAELDLALSLGAYPDARRLADAVGRLDLIRALRLTVLAARKEPRDFDLLARDWIVQAIAERALRLRDASWLYPQLQKVQDGDWRDAEKLLLIMCHRQPQ